MMRQAVARRVVVDARAKLNLGLAVGPRRPDGFHEIATIFQSISLHDTLIAEPRRRGFGLRIRHVDDARRGRSRPGRFVPAGRANLVLAAARLFAESFAIDGGATFTLLKRIPSRAGLGGGSADAAAALRAMAALYGVRPRRERLTDLGGRLGADVPFSLFGGTAIGTGRGERLTRVRLKRPFRALVAVPGWRVSTREAFDRIDRNKYGLTRWGANLRFVQALRGNRLSVERLLRLGNVFEDVLGDFRARFDSLSARMTAAGTLLPRMTGSGSAVFGLLPPGVTGERVVGRVYGKEPLFLVRSTGTGLLLKKLVT